jgi:hypothetical protein
MARELYALATLVATNAHKAKFHIQSKNQDVG